MNAADLFHLARLVAESKCAGWEKLEDRLRREGESAAQSARNAGVVEGIPKDLQDRLRDLTPCPCPPCVCVDGHNPKGTFCKMAKASAAPAPAATTAQGRHWNCPSCWFDENVQADARECPGCGVKIPETPGPARPGHQTKGFGALGFFKSKACTCMEVFGEDPACPIHGINGTNPVPDLTPETPGPQPGREMETKEQQTDALNRFARPAEPERAAGEAHDSPRDSDGQGSAAASPVPATLPDASQGKADCGCWQCLTDRGNFTPGHMVVCVTCGNKRCPHATHHDHACTNSNESGQHGSIYGDHALRDASTPQVEGMPSRETLRRQIATDPDIDNDATPPESGLEEDKDLPPEKLWWLVCFWRTHYRRLSLAISTGSPLPSYKELLFAERDGLDRVPTRPSQPVTTVGVTVEQIAAAIEPALFSDDHETSHRAASPWSVESARVTVLNKAARVLTRLQSTGGKP